MRRVSTSYCYRFKFETDKQLLYSKLTFSAVSSAMSRSDIGLFNFKIKN